MACNCDSWTEAQAALAPDWMCCNQCCDPCSSCSDSAWINIQSTNDCLTVDTSECGVVKLTVDCPPEVVAWENVTVDVDNDPTDWHTIYTVNAECDDKFVAVCGNDEEPGYLKDKVIAWTWITVETLWCDTAWWDAKLRISVNQSEINDEDKKVAVDADCTPNYLKNLIVSRSKYVDIQQDNCKMVITDKDVSSPVQYAICTHTWWSYNMAPNVTERIYAVNSWNVSPSDGPYFSWTWELKWTSAFKKGTGFNFIEIKEPWLYNFTYESYAYWTAQLVYAVRAWLWVNWLELWDFKYNWTTWTDQDWFYQYLNLWYPGEYEATWDKLALDNLWLWFSWSFTLLIDSASSASPIWVRFAVKPDSRMLSDPRILPDYKDNLPNFNVCLSDSTQEMGPQTVVTITKLANMNQIQNFKVLS